jgi:prevent-host-death family protein
MVLLAAISLTNLTNPGEWRTIEAIERAMEAAMAGTQVNLYEAKTHLSSLVDRAAKGEEFVIAKAGKPMAKLSAVSVEEQKVEPLPFGQNLLGIEFLADDWEKDIPLEWFEDEEEDKLLSPGGVK